MYQKEIIYMSLYKDNLKESCVGYLKSEERQGKFRLELQIKNIPKSLTGDYPIRIQNTTGWHEAGNLMLQEGNGIWTGSMTEPVMRAEVILSDVSVIKGQSKSASISEERVIEQLDAAKSEENGNELQDENELQEKESIEKESIEESREKEFREEERAQDRVEAVKSAEQVQVKAEPVVNELKAQAGKELREAGAEKQTMPENVPLYESKWEQLLATYEQIHPYGDSRVYVKLEPKDFVILPSGYQHLVNNSFLLHGFYNYRYLILGKEKDFYLGVPGVFYEREKMVALMFGFEAFECEGGNAKEGKFGYYLRKVEL